ncbi:hypothetical protein PINS_up008147 [Pythium insidiosum]|nr:hypothetical protein PINS_up008147 [Pythium insidiosum]
MGIECVETLQSALKTPRDAVERDDPREAWNETRRPAKRSRLRDSGSRNDGEEDAAATSTQPKTSTTRPSDVVPTLLPSTRQIVSSSLVLADTTKTLRRRRQRVFIWDLDETLVLFASLYSGQFARLHGKDVTLSVALGEQMMTYLLALLDRHFFFSELHDADVDHISSIPESVDAAVEERPCAGKLKRRIVAGKGALDGKTHPSSDDEHSTNDDANDAEEETGEGADATECSPCLREDDEAHAITAPHNTDLRALERGSPQYYRVIAARYARIRAIYERRGTGVDFLDDATSQWFVAREALVASIDRFSSGWLREAKELLELISQSSSSSRSRRSAQFDDDYYDDDNDDDAATSTGSSSFSSQGVDDVNVMVTNTQFAPALCKCLIYGLDTYFPIDMIYSSAKVHKQRCFESIIAKFRRGSGSRGSDDDSDSDDDDVEFIAIGDGAEEEAVSHALGIKFYKIRSLQDLRQLRYELELA